MVGGTTATCKNAITAIITKIWSVAGHVWWARASRGMIASATQEPAESQQRARDTGTDIPGDGQMATCSYEYSYGHSYPDQLTQGTMWHNGIRGWHLGFRPGPAEAAALQPRAAIAKHPPRPISGESICPCIGPAHESIVHDS